jgi:hypothetical protein
MLRLPLPTVRESTVGAPGTEALPPLLLELPELELPDPDEDELPPLELDEPEPELLDPELPEDEVLPELN